MSDSSVSNPKAPRAGRQARIERKAETGEWRSSPIIGSCAICIPNRYALIFFETTAMTSSWQSAERRKVRKVAEVRETLPVLRVEE
jgi:hypothetical protein